MDAKLRGVSKTLLPRCVLRCDVQPDDVTSVRRRDAHRPSCTGRGSSAAGCATHRRDAPGVTPPSQLSRAGDSEPDAGGAAAQERRVTRQTTLGGLGERAVEGALAAAGPHKSSSLARPEEDAGGALSSRVGAGAAEGGRAPRPDRRQGKLARPTFVSPAPADDPVQAPQPEPTRPPGRSQCGRTPQLEAHVDACAARANACSHGAGRYSSRTIVAACAIAATVRRRRVAPAWEMKSCGWAPRAASPERAPGRRPGNALARAVPRAGRRRARSGRYRRRAAGDAHGVLVSVPSRGIARGSAGLAGVPTARLSDMSQKASCAPPRRASAAVGSCAGRPSGPGGEDAGRVPTCRRSRSRRAAPVDDRLAPQSVPPAPRRPSRPA